jgi:xanthosine utilization system XapX-like protein
MKRIKDIMIMFAAAIIVCIGVTLVAVYLSQAPSFISILLGITGFIILSPAIEFYKDLINNKS